MTKKQKAAELKALEVLAACDTHDCERDHIVADKALCDLLTALGFTVVVEAYERVGKWYA